MGERVTPASALLPDEQPGALRRFSANRSHRKAPMLSAGLLTLVLVGCAVSGGQRAQLIVPIAPQPIGVDGRLDEACYGRKPLLDRFVVAGAPDRRPQPTRVWIFWDTERLLFAFDVTDTNLRALPPSNDEHAVDEQDRVEVFLWTGRSSDPYYCIELGARGAVHDYAARFYRRFDDSWAPSDWQHAVTPKPDGYQVEMALSRAALREMGLELGKGQRLRAGLFRADFRSSASEPTWICWVDARAPKPDFHVAGAFGDLVLSEQTP
jgi:hypothetical protein